MNPPPVSPKRYKALTISLIVASIGCLLMIVLRALVTGSVRHGFLLWNLVLAWIPYGLSLVIYRISSTADLTPRIKIVGAGVGLVWLFFYPNAPYMLTDFIHIIRAPVEQQLQGFAVTANALLWYDIILSSVFAFIGHILGLISLVILNQTIRERYNKRIAWTFVIGAILLGGYGIYLGRFRGFNSWDIFSHPLAILSAAFLNLLNLKAVLFSLAFAFFIFLTYLVVWSLHESARKK
jgi:uncharacterized membrane protein